MQRKLLTGILAATMIVGLCGCEPLYREEQANYKELALAEMAGENYDKAIEYIDEALGLCTGKITSTEVELNYYKGAALFSQKKYDEAVACYSALIEYDGSYFEPYFLRGSVYAKMGDFAKASEDFNKAIDLDPQNYDLYIKIYDVASLSGHDAEASKFIDKALSLQNDKADGYTARGRIYYYLGSYDAAQSELQKAIDKGSSEAKVYLAKVYEDRGDDATAKTLLTEYVNTGKGNSEAMCSLGNMALEAGQYKEALGYFQTGIEIDDAKSKQELYRGEITALEYLGEFKDAKLKMAKYLEEYPTDEKAAREMVFLQTR